MVTSEQNTEICTLCLKMSTLAHLAECSSSKETASIDRPLAGMRMVVKTWNPSYGDRAVPAEMQNIDQALAVQVSPMLH